SLREGPAVDPELLEPRAHVALGRRGGGPYHSAGVPHTKKFVARPPDSTMHTPHCASQAELSSVPCLPELCTRARPMGWRPSNATLAPLPVSRRRISDIRDLHREMS